jgi:hypothetical protein
MSSAPCLPRNAASRAGRRHLSLCQRIADDRRPAPGSFEKRRSKLPWAIIRERDPIARTLGVPSFRCGGFGRQCPRRCVALRIYRPVLVALRCRRRLVHIGVHAFSPKRCAGQCSSLAAASGSACCGLGGLSCVGLPPARPPMPASACVHPRAFIRADMRAHVLLRCVRASVSLVVLRCAVMMPPICGCACAHTWWALAAAPAALRVGLCRPTRAHFLAHAAAVAPTRK